MTTPQLQPPYKGGWDERFLYYSAGLLATAHILVIGTNQIISGMVPTNDICGSTSILHWEYWSIYGQAGLTILAISFFYSLLWHTLWRWWYIPALFFTFGCFALHLFCAIWYIQYQNACDSHIQCWGGCNLNPNPGASGYWISWWTLTGVLSLICLLEGLDIVAIGRFTAVQALLLWTYGSNAGPFGYYERFYSANSSPYGVPYVGSTGSDISETRRSQDQQPLMGHTRSPLAAMRRERNSLEQELARVSRLPPGATVVGGSLIVTQ